MANYSNALAPDKLRSAVASLTEHHVPISDTVTAAVAELDRVATLRPADVTPADLTAMFGEPGISPSALILCAAEVSTSASRRESWAAALNHAAMNGLRAIAAEVPDIIEALRPAAEEHLAVIRWYAEQGAPDVSALVREHRAKDATKAAQAPVALSSWDALCVMRKDLSGRSFDWARAGRWSNPEHVAEALAFRKQLTGLDYYAEAVAAGGQVWWPTMEQAGALTARLIDLEEKAQAVTNAEDRRQKQSAF